MWLIDQDDDINPVFLIDFYKNPHISMYPEGIAQIFSNLTPRYTHVKQLEPVKVVHFGMSYFIQKYLIRPVSCVISLSPQRRISGKPLC